MNDESELARLEREMMAAWLRCSYAEQEGRVSVATLERLYGEYVQAVEAYLAPSARYQRKLLQQLRLDGMEASA